MDGQPANRAKAYVMLYGLYNGHFRRRQAAAWFLDQAGVQLRRIGVSSRSAVWIAQTTRPIANGRYGKFFLIIW